MTQRTEQCPLQENNKLARANTKTQCNLRLFENFNTLKLTKKRQIWIFQQISIAHYGAYYQAQRQSKIGN